MKKQKNPDRKQSRSKLESAPDTFCPNRPKSPSSYSRNRFKNKQLNVNQVDGKTLSIMPSD